MRAQHALLSCAALLVACAADLAIDDETEPYDGPGELVVVDDDKADSADEIRVRADGMTVWVRPRIEPRTAEGEIRFVLRGRASRNLADVFSSVPDDAFGTASIVGLRGFEVELDAHQAHTLLFGLPLRITLRAPGAPHDAYVVRVRARTRLAQFSGSADVWVETPITPVLVSDQVVYRGRARIAEGFRSLGVDTLADSRPTVAPTYRGSRTFVFDLTYPRLARVVGARAPLTFTARGTAGEATKTAYLQPLVAEVAVTSSDPDAAWPAEECDPSVRACLRAGDPSGDTSSCGDAFRVTRCRWDLDVEPSAEERFADDLRAHLADWYAVRGADVIASGGNDLAAARAAVSASAVFAITDPEDDPLGYDLVEVLLLAHPDVAFPGSDRVWLGAYDRASGARLTIVDFN